MNNAGAVGLVSITAPDFYQQYKNLLELNLNSVVLLIHLSVPHLEKAKGNIVNISSISALRSVIMILPKI